MDIENMKAAQRITAGQAVRTTGSGTVTPAIETEKLHTSPFFGVALETVDPPHNVKVKVQISGVFTLRSLGSDGGKSGAVGVDSSGQLVRAASKECVSAPNWIGDCDASGTVTIRPRRDTRLSVLDFGAVGNGNTDDADAIQSALDCAMRLDTTDGSVVYLPPGDYRIKKPLVISKGCILEGAGLARHDETSRILADVESGNFNLNIGAVGGEIVYCAIALVGYATGLAMTPPRGRADYAVLRQLALHSIPAQGMPAATFQAPQMDGIRVMATGACIERMSVVSFRRNGIEISSNLDAPAVDASGVQIRDCLLTSNGQNGLDMGSLGNDNASNMLIMNVSATANGRDGICDNSRLGSTFVSCHTAANRRRNYSCDGKTRPSVYVGCYGEIDAPSVFKSRNIAVIGGDIDTTSDSVFWGFNSLGKGPSALRVVNDYSKVHKYWIAETGVDIEEGEVQTPGNGYVYRATRAGRTFGVNGLPPEKKGMPDFKPDTDLEELDGLVWECEGEYKPQVTTSNTLGSYGEDPTIIHDFQIVTVDGKLQLAGDSLFRTQVQTGPPGIKGRVEASLLSHGLPFHTYYQTAYENGPLPGKLMLPEAWIGRYDTDKGERRICVVYSGTPFDTSVGSCNFYSPGDLILNALDNKTRRGPIGWAVQAACGKGELARAWTRGTHYHIGQTVRPTHANHFLYRLTAYITDGPLDPGLNVSGEQDPWDNHTQSVGSLTTDNHLVWQTLYDLDDPANKWCIEPLPQRAEKQTKSNATNIGQLKDDFNALLDKMRKANLLE
ncbi:MULTISPECIES: right-handed parallel beta-helix repeat-containing protein [unclassified Streptomyces]|uniref:right-handed parallel beta-helix repeat-containing protein n=1 Tax=unclassified Streptomyces TaxID=2593676 RepID=UPI002E1FDD79